MFAVLGLSEEREPVAVLKSASKRAQRRAQRAEARQQENVVDKGPKSALDWQNEVALQNASTRLYDELFGDTADVDPSLLEDLAANFHSLGLGQAGPDVVGRGHGGRDNKARNAAANGTNGNGSGAAVARPGLSGFSAARLGSAPPAMASNSDWHSSLDTHIDVPPGPGPGSGSYGGSGSGNGAWSSGQVPSSLLRSPARQPLLGAGPGLGSWAGSSGGASPFHTGGAPRGSPRTPPPPQREEFPQLQAAGSSPAGQQAGGPGGRQGAGAGSRRKARGNGSGQFRNGAFGRNGSGGIKVLNAARPVSDGEQSLHRSGSDASSDLSLQLVWELLDENMVQLEDPLAGCEGGAAAGAGAPGGLGGSAGASDAAVKAVIRRLVEAQCGEEDGGPARGLSQEDMIAMMAKAHRRQLASSRARARARARAAAGGQGGEQQEQGEGSSDEEEEDDDEDDGHYYTSREETKTWRRTVEWMERNDWVRVTDTDGKHYKYRRLLPNGRIQTQTVCCSPSDAMRGVRNLQADLARKDAEANEVIRAWRQEQRARAREAAAAAARAAREEQDG